MNKILIIPDVHGRTFWKKAIELIDTVDKVVFLGDYLDPYYHENISKLDTITNFKEILEFKKNNFDKVILLIGNHDLHYWPQYYKDWGCRRDDTHFYDISKLFMDNLNCFQLSWKYDKYLFTHAGVTKDWFDIITGKSKIGDSTYAELMEIEQPELTLDDLNTLLETKFGHNVLMMVSRERGGHFLAGSCIWADIYEHLSGNPIDNNIFQIFAHTMVFPDIYKPYINNHFAMLDSQHCYILNIKTNDIMEEKMD